MLKMRQAFYTYEYIEEVSLMVIKKDGRREPFDRKKILIRDYQGLREKADQHGKDGGDCYAG